MAETPPEPPIEELVEVEAPPVLDELAPAPVEDLLDELVFAPDPVELLAVAESVVLPPQAAAAPSIEKTRKPSDEESGVRIARWRLKTLPLVNSAYGLGGFAPRRGSQK